MNATLLPIRIGSVRGDGFESIARIVHAKCRRAEHSHTGVAVLMDDYGYVYASQVGSGNAEVAMLMHPEWLVAVYSLMDVDSAPNVRQIVDDLVARDSEIRRAA
jgi:hypothetical protein